jgi:hypothetical protein
MPTGIQYKFSLSRAGILEQSMGARHRVGKGCRTGPPVLDLRIVVNFLSLYRVSYCKISIAFLGSAKGGEPNITPIVSYLCGTCVIVCG